MATQEVHTVLGRERARLALALVVCITVVFALPQGALATVENAGTFGAIFLQIPVGPKAMSVPGIVAGMRPDASLVFSNPAAPAGISANEIYLTRASWLDALSLNAAGLVLQAPMELKWSLGSRLLYSGGLTGYDSSEQPVAEGSFYDLAFSTGLSRRFRSIGLDLGFGVTYVREHLPLENASGVVYSVGATYRRAGHRFELFAQDLGGSLKFPGRAYPIDSRYGFGYGRTFRVAWGSFDVGAQLTVSRSDYQRVQVGASYLANPLLTLRTGFEHVFAGPTSTQLPVRAGLGVHIGSISLDYAYTSQKYFSSTHTVSFGYSFGSEAGKSSGASRRRAPHRSTQDEITKASAAVASRYAVFAGTHGRLESAQAEARALRLLKVPAVVETSGAYYRVLIGKYDSQKDAKKALSKYRGQGHVFTLEVING